MPKSWGDIVKERQAQSKQPKATAKSWGDIVKERGGNYVQVKPTPVVKKAVVAKLPTPPPSKNIFQKGADFLKGEAKGVLNIGKGALNFVKRIDANVGKDASMGDAPKDLPNTSNGIFNGIADFVGQGVNMGVSVAGVSKLAAKGFDVGAEHLAGKVLTKAAPKITPKVARVGTDLIKSGLHGSNFMGAMESKKLLTGEKVSPADIAKGYIEGIPIGVGFGIGGRVLGKGFGKVVEKFKKPTIDAPPIKKVLSGKITPNQKLKPLALNAQGKQIAPLPSAEMKKFNDIRVTKGEPSLLDASGRIKPFDPNELKAEQYYKTIAEQEKKNLSNPDYIRAENAQRVKQKLTPIADVKTSVVTRKERLPYTETKKMESTIKPKGLKPLSSDTKDMVKVLDKNGMKIDEIINETRSKMKTIEDNHFNFLKDADKTITGTGNKGIIRNDNGTVVKSYNVGDKPEWSDSFRTGKGRTPTLADKQNMVQDHLENGFQHYGDVPSNSEYLALKKELNELENIKAGKPKTFTPTKYLESGEKQKSLFDKTHENKAMFFNEPIYKTDAVVNKPVQTPTDPPQSIFKQNIPQAQPLTPLKSNKLDAVTQAKGGGIFKMPETKKVEMMSASLPSKPAGGGIFKDATPTESIFKSETPSAKIEDGKAISKVYSNSLMQGKVITEEGKKALKEIEFAYDVKPNEKSLGTAQERFNTHGVDAERERLIKDGVNSAEDTMSHYLISKELMAEARTTGDYTKANRFLESTRPSFTNAGQTIQALKSYKWDSAEGAVVNAHKVVDAVERDVKKTNPRKIKEVDVEAKKVNDELKELTDAQKEKRLKEIFKTESKSTPKNILERVRELIDLGAYDNESIRNLIKEKNGIPTLSNSEVKFIVEQMDKSATLPKGSYEQRAAVSKARTLIEGKEPSTTIEKSRALKNISLLLNSATVSVNNVGNSLMAAADSVANVVGTPISKAMQKKTGFGTHAIPNLKIMGKGAVTGIKEQGQDTLGGLVKGDLKGKSVKEKYNIIKNGLENPINTSNVGGEKFEGANKSVFKNKTLRKLENIQKTAITDRPFEQMHYDDVINQLKKANKTNVVTDEMKNIAEQVAKERTYKDDNKISKIATSIRNTPMNILDKGGLTTALQMGADTIVPYVKTPANIIKRGLEYTPEGIIEGIVKLKHANKTGTLDMAKQREIIDRIARGIVGTGIMGGGYAAGKAGFSTSSPSKNYQAEQWNKSIGRQNNAIKVGDKNISYGKLPPISMPFSAGSNLGNKKSKVEGLGNTLLESATDSMDFYADQPMIQTLKKFMGSQYDNKGTSERVMESLMELPKQYIPTILKQVRQLADEYERETYSPDKITNNLINQAKNKIPGMSNSLPKKVDIRGENVKTPSLAQIIANPIPITTEKHSPGIDLINKLYDSTGDAGVLPNMADKKMSYKKLKIPLKPGEYVNSQKMLGQANMKLMELLAKDKAFNALREEDQVKTVKKYYEKISEGVKINTLVDIIKNNKKH